MMKYKKISYIVKLFLLILIIVIVSNLKIYIVKTGSMEPSLKINEMIFVRNKKKNTKYQVGDIITYIDKETGITITHRIVNIIEDKIYTKGDYNNYMDINYIEYDDIIGKVIWHTYILGFLYSNYKIQILFFLFVGISIINIYNAIEKRKKHEI